MAWVKVDDHFSEHPKFMNLNMAQKGLWLEGMAYSNRNLTDGYVPKGALRLLGARIADARALVAVTLWEIGADDGYVIHDYSDYQPTREQVLSKRAAWKARQQMSRRDTPRDTPRDLLSPVPVPVPVPEESTVDIPTVDIQRASTREAMSSQTVLGERTTSRPATSKLPGERAGRLDVSRRPTHPLPADAADRATNLETDQAIHVADMLYAYREDHQE